MLCMPYLLLLTKPKVELLLEKPYDIGFESTQIFKPYFLFLHLFIYKYAGTFQTGILLKI